MVRFRGLGVRGPASLKKSRPHGDAGRFGASEAPEQRYRVSAELGGEQDVDVHEQRVQGQHLFDAADGRGIRLFGQEPANRTAGGVKHALALRRSVLDAGGFRYERETTREAYELAYER